MPRRPRILIPGVPLHLIQRGNNRSACFFCEDDFRYYLEQLAEQAEAHGCAVHAYCLMTNHVHLLLTPSRADSAGKMMKALGQRYVQYVNRTYRRSGTLWEGRFRSCPVENETYLLVCHRYIELNPVRVGMVAHPGEYRWSSYRGNADAESVDPLLMAHAAYHALGRDEAERVRAYQELFQYLLEPGILDAIRVATNGNFALGQPRFTAQIEEALGRRATPGRPGPPRKQADTQTEKNVV